MSDGAHDLDKLNAALERKQETRPSEAAMREAREIVNRYGSCDFIQEIALALDRHAAAQREKDAQYLDNMAVWAQEKVDKFGRSSTLGEPFVTHVEIYKQAAAAIRSAT